MSDLFKLTRKKDLPFFDYNVLNLNILHLRVLYQLHLLCQPTLFQRDSFLL